MVPSTGEDLPSTYASTGDLHIPSAVLSDSCPFFLHHLYSEVPSFTGVILIPPDRTGARVRREVDAMVGKRYVSKYMSIVQGHWRDVTCP